MTDQRRCTATTKNGTPCRSWPLHDLDVCMSHAPADRRASVGFTPEAGRLGGRPPRPSRTEVMVAQIERRSGEILAVLFDALTASRGLVVGSGDNAALEFVPDHAVRLAGARELLDRWLGKPRQATDATVRHAGLVVGVNVEPDEARLAAVLAVLVDAGVLPRGELDDAETAALGSAEE